MFIKILIDQLIQLMFIIQNPNKNQQKTHFTLILH